MASNCRIEAALEIEFVSFFESVLLARQCHTPQEYTQSQYIQQQDAWSCWARLSHVTP